MQHPPRTPRTEVHETRRRRLARRARLAFGLAFYSTLAAVGYVVDDWTFRAVLAAVTTAIAVVHGLLSLAVSVLKAADTP